MITSKDVEKEIDNASGYDQVVLILRKYKDVELKPAVLGKAFEKMFVKNSFSDPVQMDFLVEIHPSFRERNGSTWTRSNQSYLGKKYNIRRRNPGEANGPIKLVQIDGPNKQLTINNKIRKDIQKTICDRRCAILDIGTSIECDHKDGMKDDWRLNDESSQQLEDFQPLCKTANIAKREHCNKCKSSEKRYDAKQLGYSYSFTFGDEHSKTCIGCYWYDPIQFNRDISKNYKNKE